MICLSVRLAAPAWAQSAGAQSADAQPADNSDNTIVVTAQRRQQNLLDVPLSIGAASGPALEAKDVREVSDLRLTTPGLISNNGSGYVQLFIRGVGNMIFVGADPSIATLIDDVPRIYGSMVNDFVNVERVEVFKGAQGGLYGRNATGGVVNIVTHKPDPDAFAADLTSRFGSYNTATIAGYVNVPLASGLAFNMSAERETHDGYVDNALTTTSPYTAAMFPTGSYLGTPQQTANFFNSAVNPPERLGHKDFWAVEGKARYESARFDLTIAGDYANKNDDSGNEYNNIDPEDARALSSAIFQSFGICPPASTTWRAAPSWPSAASPALPRSRTTGSRPPAPGRD
jgi:outer membrane receptor protein involved in Fe transport